MSWTAFFLILVSVFLHAGWNFMCKSKRASMAFYLLTALSAVVLLSPFPLLCRIEWSTLPARFRLLLLASGCCEVLYNYGLFRAYRHNDISLAYPLVRALPVLMTAGVTILLGLGRAPGMLSLFGMGVVSAGCLLIPLKRWSEFRPKSYFTPALRFILLAALCTTGYTIFDSLAAPLLAEHSDSSDLLRAGTYLFWCEIIMSIGIGFFVIRSRKERGEFRRLFLRSPYPVLCGAFSSAAYILVLIAMLFVTNVSYIQAFRQMSLPIGVFAGIVLLHENRSPIKLTGVALLVAGLLLVALGQS